MTTTLAIAGFDHAPAIDYEPGMTRRDPSPVIHADDRYHVWYSKNPDAGHGFTATVWHADSPDGLVWTERELAIAKGGPGSWNECGVFTPSIFVAEGRYWMTFTAMPKEWHDGQQTTKGAIGLAVSDSPDGPWETMAEPIIRCSDDPEVFDSLRVDDSCIIARDGAYWLYYKGRQWDRPPSETKMGVAIAEHPAGPYRKHPGNPILDRGHEVCVWPHDGGVAAMVVPCGPPERSLWYAPDGLAFARVQDCAALPQAAGPYRDDAFVDGADCSCAWGLAIGGGGHLGERAERPYLLRWEMRR